MYMLTWQHAAAFPSETERLWCTVAANKRNVIPILDFLITRGLQEASEPHLQACCPRQSILQSISLHVHYIQQPPIQTRYRN